MNAENLRYIESLICDYQEKKINLDNTDWHTLLENEPKLQATQTHQQTQIGKNTSVDVVVNLFRNYGNTNANLSPIPQNELPNKAYFLTQKNAWLKATPKTIDHSLHGLQTPCSPEKLVAYLEKCYCGSSFVETHHILDPNEKEWLCTNYEKTIQNTCTQDDKTDILYELLKAEGLEQYLHKRFVAQKRFSLEGSETLIPVLQQLLKHIALTYKTQYVPLGMAHRGRLNVLMNILGKPPEELFKEFSHQSTQTTLMGDVKYHLGRSAVLEFKQQKIHVSLLFNPSHLAIVTPIAIGKCAGIMHSKHYNTQEIMPIIVHGDSAFCGQGVIMETLSLSKTDDYNVGGSLHIIVNNQIGFTTSKSTEMRSSEHATDVAKMISAPIFHVNANDPERAVHIVKLAADYRMKFNKDVIVDLIGWRKYGHNEADDPSITQPTMYQFIKKQPSIHSHYASKLKNQFLDEDALKTMQSSFLNKLENNRCLQPHLTQNAENIKNEWSSYLTFNDKPVKTNVSKTALQALNQKINVLPSTFNAHFQIKKVYDARLKMLNGELELDWGCAENLAYATLIQEGFSIRISGQDSIRGTFSHRHAYVFDQNTNEKYCPIHNITNKKNDFKVINSTLSELAVSGFEYGYSISSVNSLVIWEAQFGDFVNGAQITIDQYLSSGHAKWNLLSNLVMLLPHGYEGQGAEHSSARPERFLQLAAMNNMHVCYPTNASQIFHLLRRQMHASYKRPLIIMSPKSLLRKPSATCQLSDLTDGKFLNIIHTPSSKKTRKLVLCTGKIFYDIKDALTNEKIDDIALIRVEQLYPFPKKEIENLLKTYSNVPIAWCQEEPENQGFWWFIAPKLHAIFNKKITYLGRAEAAATACGSLEIHKQEQKKIIQTVIK